MSLIGRLVVSEDALAPYLAEWDRLATTVGRPYCLPEWMLAWWRHAAPSQAQLRVLLALAGDRLVGVAPFFGVSRRVGRSRYAFLAAGNGAPIEPLAEAGMEVPAAQVFARTLAHTRPAPGMVVLQGMPIASPWPTLLAGCWPGGAASVHRRPPRAIPVVDLGGGSFDAWLGQKSGSFRRDLRRGRRRLNAAGAKFRLARTAGELERGLGEFARLHYANWAPRGGSSGLGPPVERTLLDAGTRLLERCRFRLWTVEVDRATIAAQVAVATGGTVALWGTGFDEAWSKHSPGVHAALAAIEDAFARGERRVLLGVGDQLWKRRFADAAAPIEYLTLIPPGAGALAVRGELVVLSARGAVSRRVPAPIKGRIRERLRAVRG